MVFRLLILCGFSVPEIIFVGAHIKPQKVVEELTEMIRVHESIKEKYGNDIPVVFMGDFNADGRYTKFNLKFNFCRSYVNSIVRFELFF